MKYVSDSQTGLVRSTNQDRTLLLEHKGVLLAVVCDGIGGGNAGDKASEMTVSLLKDAFLRSHDLDTADDLVAWFTTTLDACNQNVFAKSQSDRNLKGMGTTCAAVMIVDRKAVGFNVGDSRIYDYRRKQLSVVSHDQTYAYMMYMQNEISIEEIAHHPKRNVLMNAVGISQTITAETIRIPDGWDRILVCSDGLYGYVDAHLIEEAIEEPLHEAKVSLMKLAYDAGGFDNVSFVIVEGDSNV